MRDLLTDSGAKFSDCKLFRYKLWRIWDPTKPPLIFVMLNPSTADEVNNDPTVGRCESRALRGGFGRLEVFNIFAFRATDPDDMKAATDPVGPLNDAHLLQAFEEAKFYGGTVVAAWGVHGAHRGRADAVRALAAERRIELHHLGLTKDGHPRHPLYLPSTQPLAIWSHL